VRVGVSRTLMAFLCFLMGHKWQQTHMRLRTCARCKAMELMRG